jgi:hypothetical protein
MMKRRSLSPPNQRNYQKGYELALRLASQKLNSTDIAGQCQKAGTEIKMVGDKKAIIIEYLSSSYQIILPEVDVFQIGVQEPVPLKDKLLMLHYLTRAGGSPITGNLITYKEIPDGANYLPTFYKRAIKPLIDNFTKEPNCLLDAAERFGGHKADYGDMAVTIDAFNRVPLTLVLWCGDDELASEGNILFDINISDYLSTEDITVLCETIVWRLVNILRERK